MYFVRPKILGTLKIEKMMAGNYAVTNGIKNPPNKILIPCRSKKHAQEVLLAISNASAGEELQI